MTSLPPAPPAAPKTGSGTESSTHSDLLLKLLFHALRVSDAFLNEAAAELLVRFGTHPVPRLVRVAVDRTNGRPHRLRALAAIGRIGSLSRPEDGMDLQLLLRETDPKFREVVYRVLPALGIPAGPPKPTPPVPG